MSQNSGNQVLIGLTGMSNTNVSNTGTLLDQQSLMWGDNGLSKRLSVVFSHIVGSTTINSRFASIWKLQNTGNVRVMWPVGITSLHLVQSTDDVISVSDTFTAMTATQTINGVTYNYADVTLDDGQYFTFAGYANSPEGVLNGLTQWYRADKNVSISGTNVSSWTDQAQGVVSSQISTSPLPLYVSGSTNYFNFNPGVNFTLNTQKLGNISVQTFESTSYDIFTLTKEGLSSGRIF